MPRSGVYFFYKKVNYPFKVETVSLEWARMGQTDPRSRDRETIMTETEKRAYFEAPR